jgi:hypothetical protein
LSCPRVRQRSEPVDVDRGQLGYPSLKDIAVVMDLHEPAPVGGRSASGGDWRRLERLAEVRKDLPDRPRLDWSGCSQRCAGRDYDAARNPAVPHQE